MGIVGDACRAAKVSRSLVYKTKEENKTFKKDWEDALEDAADTLEHEAIRRARDGVREPVIYKGMPSIFWMLEGRPVPEGTEGAVPIPLSVTKYSDKLLMFLLVGNRPSKYRQKVDKAEEMSIEDLGEQIRKRVAEVDEPITIRQPGEAGGTSSQDVADPSTPETDQPIPPAGSERQG